MKFDRHSTEINDVITTLHGDQYRVYRVLRRYVIVHRNDGKLTPTITVYYGSIATNKGLESREKRLACAIDTLSSL